jgi:hypothetical protein
MVDYTRGRHRLSLKNFFARGEKLTADSVSLSDWLGRQLLCLHLSFVLPVDKE